MSVKVESISTREGIECEDCCGFADKRVITPGETFHLCSKHYREREDEFDRPRPVGETTSLA